jgi:hypothetical protein
MIMEPDALPVVQLITGGWDGKNADHIRQLAAAYLDGVAAVELLVARGKLQDNTNPVKPMKEGGPLVGGLEQIVDHALTDPRVHVIVTLDTRAHRFIRAFDQHLHPQQRPRPAIVATAMSPESQFPVGPNQEKWLRPSRMTGVVEPDLPSLVANQLYWLIRMVGDRVKRVRILHYANQGSHGRTDKNLELLRAGLHQFQLPEFREGRRDVPINVDFLLGNDEEIRIGREAERGHLGTIDSLDKAFKRFFDPVDDQGLLVLPSAMASYYRRAIIRNAEEYQVPTVYPYRACAAEGGLVSYGPPKPFDRLMDMVRGILKSQQVRGFGKEEVPAPLVLSPMTFELAVNRSTAKALGVEVPENVMEYSIGEQVRKLLNESKLTDADRQQLENDPQD